ncbi:MAG TPA: hemerythrin domain-containing protein [Candidatus Nitrosotalea sp.]|nr:hemerythrin domain-containing protein [Candidatus Nitrosotalea sp.]
MSATETLRNDHRQIRRLEKIVVQAYTRLYAGQDVPFQDLEKMVEIMLEFLDAIHYSREEDAYFACVGSYGTLKEEIRAFMIEHELSRRIAGNISRHLQRWKKGEDAREPVARFLKAYAVYLDDHLKKEDAFFDLAEKEVLSPEEEKMMYEEFRAVNATVSKLEDLVKSIGCLEKAEWMS